MTIREVAKRANVSIATVSRTLRSTGVVNDETAKRVMQAIKELNYRPNTYAQSLVSGRTRMLGLVVSDITNPFFPEVIRGFQDIALQSGYDVMMAATNYPALATHRLKHRELTRQVEDFVTRYEKGDITLSVQLLNFLSEWLTTHIQGEDQLYGPWLVENGVK